MEQQTLVVAEVELELMEQEDHYGMVVLVVQESLLLDTNFKINMYLLTFKINI